MGLTLRRPVLVPVVFALVAAMIVLLYDHFYGPKQGEMMQVGGKMNQCTCSQRLEK